MTLSQWLATSLPLLANRTKCTDRVEKWVGHCIRVTLVAEFDATYCTSVSVAETDNQALCCADMGTVSLSFTVPLGPLTSLSLSSC
jgi:hypothetical protein